jgi:hypothetical protein
VARIVRFWRRGLIIRLCLGLSDICPSRSAAARQSGATPRPAARRETRRPRAHSPWPRAPPRAHAPHPIAMTAKIGRLSAKSLVTCGPRPARCALRAPARRRPCPHDTLEAINIHTHGHATASREARNLPSPHLHCLGSRAKEAADFRDEFDSTRGSRASIRSVCRTQHLFRPGTKFVVQVWFRLQCV